VLTLSESGGVFWRTGPFFDLADTVFVPLEGLVESWFAFSRCLASPRERMKIPSRTRPNVVSSPVATKVNASCNTNRRWLTHPLAHVVGTELIATVVALRELIGYWEGE